MRRSIASTQRQNEKFERMAGIRVKDATSWEYFVRLVNRACHPSNLAMMRIMFGLIMMADLVLDRGMSTFDLLWDDPYRCHFPLFSFVTLLPVEWMMMICLLMFICLLCMTVGLFYRVTSVTYFLLYAYIYLSDRTRWSNHSSYMFFLAFILSLTDANRYWSLDGLIWPQIRNAHVPMWNYYLLRLQVFILYFISGLKKLHPDWIGAYSQKLGHRAAFAPFRLFFSVEFINLVLVHMGGLFIDLFIGFLLYFDKTRPLGLFIGFGFHTMNFFLYGLTLYMFPFISMATLLVFCKFDWPLNFCEKWICKKLVSRETPQPSDHCVYTKEDIEQEKQNGVSDLKHRTNVIDHKYSLESHENKPIPPSKVKYMKTNVGMFNKLLAVFVICYTAQQFFTPYSHFITKGWGGWREGMPGYSWDMMVHRVNTTFVQIKYVNKHTGQVGYINKEAFYIGNQRWNMHADMTKQFASCIADRLKEDFNVTDIDIYFDVWKQQNERINQRCLDHEVDILTAPWNVLKPTPWITPLLPNVKQWRGYAVEQRALVQNWDNFTKVRFVADYPDTHLKHFVRKDVAQVNITNLEGEITIHFPNQANKTVVINKGETFHNLPVEEFHIVYVTSQKPAVYYYTFVDLKQKTLQEEASVFSTKLCQQRDVTDESKLDVEDLMPKFGDSEEVVRLKEAILARRGLSTAEYTRQLVTIVTDQYRKAFVGMVAAAKSIYTGEKMANIMAEMWQQVPIRKKPVFLDEYDSHNFI